MTQAARKKNSKYSQHESNLSPHVLWCKTNSKTVLDFGFQLLDSGPQVWDSGIRISLHGRNQYTFVNSPGALPLSFRRPVESKSGACDPCLPIGRLWMFLLANRDRSVRVQLSVQISDWPSVNTVRPFLSSSVFFIFSLLSLRNSRCYQCQFRG